MDDELRPAKITDRFLAFVIDSAPFMAGYYASIYLLVVRLGRLPNSAAVWKQAFAVWLVLYLVYQTVGNASSGTVGKRLFGIRVIGRDGGTLGAGRGLLRALGYFLSMPLVNLGFLWSLYDRDSRAWHDMLAGSLVVEVEPKSPAAALGSAVLSFALFGMIFGANAWIALKKPSQQDVEAVARAREGLKVLAAIEERHKARHGVYTESIVDLARTSGDVAQFRGAMERIFYPEGFVFVVTGGGYTLRARAKDRRRTVVTLQGP